MRRLVGRKLRLGPSLRRLWQQSLGLKKTLPKTLAGAAAVLGFLCTQSCDTFRGSVVALSMAWALTMVGQQVPLSSPARLEMWARLGTATMQEYKHIVADVSEVSPASATPFTGFSVVFAVNPNDPCLIRGLDSDDEACDRVNSDGSNRTDTEKASCGAHLLGLRAHAEIDPQNPNADPLSDSTKRASADLKRQQLVQQVRKIVPTTVPIQTSEPLVSGRTTQPLLALVPYDKDFLTDPRRTLLPQSGLSAALADDPAMSRERLRLCRQARLDRRFDTSRTDSPSTFYVGNPRQYTKPLSGFSYGVFLFSTAPSMADPTLPTQNLSGISFSVPFPLDDLQEILVVLETDPDVKRLTLPDANARKLLAMRRLPDQAAGRGAIKLVVLANTDPLMMASNFTVTVGTATVLTNLDARLD